MNLFLEILGRRDDGYHEIDTVMAAIDFGDDLTLQTTPRRGEVDLRCEWIDCDLRAQTLGIAPDAPRLRLPQGKENLVWKVLRSFQSRYRPEFGFDVEIRKRVPAGAGLGGASSDAAAALRAAARLAGVPPGDPDLWTIAADHGSDIPFFLNEAAGDANVASPLQFCQAKGRGTEIQRLATDAAWDQAMARWSLVIAHPGMTLRTNEIYAALGAKKLPSVPIPDPSRQFLNKLIQSPMSGWPSMMVNTMFEAAAAQAVAVADLCGMMNSHRPDGCQMSGSGSAVFAIFESERLALRVCRQLRSRGGVLAVTARFCGLAPVVIG